MRGQLAIFLVSSAHLVKCVTERSLIKFRGNWTWLFHLDVRLSKSQSAQIIHKNFSSRRLLWFAIFSLNPFPAMSYLPGRAFLFGAVQKSRRHFFMIIAQKPQKDEEIL